MTQLFRGFVRSLSVERHEGGRPSGCSSDLGAVLTDADARNFDVVFAAVDDFVKAMHVLVTRPSRKKISRCKRRAILAAHRRGSSERSDEGASTQCNSRVSLSRTLKIVRRPPPVHRQSTLLPQLFHRAAR